MHPARFSKQLPLPSAVSLMEPQVTSSQSLHSLSSVPSTDSPLITFAGDNQSILSGSYICIFHAGLSSEEDTVKEPMIPHRAFHPTPPQSYPPSPRFSHGLLMGHFNSPTPLSNTACLE